MKNLAGKIIFGLLLVVCTLAPQSKAQGILHFTKLTWTPSTTPGVTAQKVYRGTVSAGPYTLIATIPDGTTATYQDNDMTQGVTHYYVLTAMKGTNESVFTSQVSATDLGTNVNPQTGLAVASSQ